MSIPAESRLRLSKSKACLTTGLMLVSPVAFRFFSSFVKILICSFQPTLMLVGGSSSVSNMYRSDREFIWSRPRIFLFCKNLPALMNWNRDFLQNRTKILKKYLEEIFHCAFCHVQIRRAQIRCLIHRCRSVYYKHNHRHFYLIKSKPQKFTILHFSS